MVHRKVPSPEEALRKMARYCAYQERSASEVRTKLALMGVPTTQGEHILEHLIDNDFLNEERFAKNFALGKFRQKKWGRIRIQRELAKRGIPETYRNTALNELDPKEYLQTFEYLFRKRRNEVASFPILIQRRKVSDYLLYRGWEPDLVMEKIQALILEE